MVAMTAQVSIVGAGAVGIVLADVLSRAGVEAELVVREARQADLAQRGVWLKWEQRSVQTVRVPIVTHASAPILLLAMKTFALPQAIAEHLRGRGAETQAVALQNGLTADQALRERAPQVTRIGGIVSFGATSLRPGEASVMASAPQDLHLSLGCDEGAVRDLAAFSLLAKALPVAALRSLEGARWTKLIVNLNNGLFAATKLPASRFFAHPYGAFVAARCMREGLAVAKAAGASLESLPWTSVFMLMLARVMPLGAAMSMVRRRAQRFTEAEGDTYGSTLQSVLKNEPTEIDELNGAVARLAAPLHVPVPINEAVTRAVKGFGRGEQALTVEALARL
jgi:2-dehydropantoate 2-reductase